MTLMIRWLVSGITVFFLVEVVNAAEPVWRAGLAAVVITPEQPMWMSGYASRTAPAEGKDTDLWAKALVLEDPSGRRLVLVTLDLVGIDRDLSQELCRVVMRKHRLPREAIILSVSHTHCGPVVGNNLRPMFFLDEEQAKRVADYTARLPELVLRAVDQAVARLEPARLSAGVGTATFAVNRRQNKEADVPARRARGEPLNGPVDHDVPVLAVHDLKGRLRGVVFGYACHATTLAYQRWSGDYPGYAMIELEAAHPGAVAMFWAGCGGDQNPIPRRSVELAKGYGKQLAGAVAAVLDQPLTPVAPQAQAVYAEIDLPFGDLPSREQFVRESLSDNKYVAARARLILERLQSGQSLPTSYPYPVQTWRLGRDLVWVALGGEVVVDYSLRLKKELGPGLWVMAYANDVMAYIPSARVLREGGYEGATAMIYYGLPTTWGAKVEELIVAEVARQVKQVRGR